MAYGGMCNWLCGTGHIFCFHIEEDVDPQDIRQDDGHDGIDEDGGHNSGTGNIRVSLYLAIANTHLESIHASRPGNFGLLHAKGLVRVRIVNGNSEQKERRVDLQHLFRASRQQRGCYGNTKCSAGGGEKRMRWGLHRAPLVGRVLSSKPPLLAAIGQC